MMSVMLLVPNPQKIRLALHARRHPATFPFEQTLVTDLDEPATQTSPEPEAPAADNAASEARPVQVASADPAASLGMIPQEAASQATAQKEPVLPRSMPEAAPAAIDIPVPEPVHREVPAQLAQLPVTEKPAAVEKQDDTGKPAAVPHEMVLVTESREHPIELPAATQKHKTVREKLNLSDDETITITTGSNADRWNFQFHSTPISEVLRVLAEYQGFSVIVDSQLQGTYTGEFLDAEPGQAFAIMVKTHDCQVSRRGKIVMLNKRK